MNTTCNPRRACMTTAMLLFAVLPAACGGTGPDGEATTIAADQFVDTYVALRIAALSNPRGEITPEQRDSVLTASGVRSEQMLEFAEAYGRQAAMMQSVWDSVEIRFQRRRDELNTRGTEAETPP